MRPLRSAFTLIELLIVVAIIAILAAIAVPNFLEAQTRAKVSRVKADIRSLALAVESYHVDHNAYPPNNDGPLPGGSGGLCAGIGRWMEMLSTPIAYITDGRYIDPFGNELFTNVSGQSIYFYIHPGSDDTCAALVLLGTFGSLTDPNALRISDHRWLVASAGPDRIFEVARLGGPLAGFANWFQETDEMLDIYDPTNGTISIGEIYRTAKGFSLEH